MKTLKYIKSGAQLKSKKKDDELKNEPYRVPPVVDYTNCNIYNFFKCVKNSILISKNCNDLRILQKNSDQVTRQLHQLKIEQPYKYTNKNQVCSQNLEDVFNLSNSLIKIKYFQVRIKGDEENKNIQTHMSFSNLHMYPELMEQVPENLSDWIVVPHPVGQRTILVSRQGKTELYSEKGVLLACFNSELPGGVKKDSQKMSDKLCTVLDCIWVKKKQIIYLLDCLFWCETPVYHCAADERFSYLKSEIENDTKLLRKKVKGHNNYSIIRLPFQYYSSGDTMSKYFEEIAKIDIDKIVFYHRNSLYLNGKTPLVLWLGPFMLPEILNNDNITFPQQFINKKPPDYIDFTEFKNKVEDNKGRGKKIKSNKANCKERNKKLRSVSITTEKGNR